MNKFIEIETKGPNKMALINTDAVLYVSPIEGGTFIMLRDGKSYNAANNYDVIKSWLEVL